ncbi:hypothetical protein [Mycoavidus sp. B2-EB]|uniref:hypothetical protein n=1 Tax=Mycoavidus sp. B2-EB TaxID=2651972 RepID=UPI001625F8A8|nr:hypothetical protein [Mycoavidus sp. B2-EB]BBO59035.1 hypothetical protein MPB2EB_0136 [Mycoavidus sp. B2-EB]
MPINPINSNVSLPVSSTANQVRTNTIKQEPEDASQPTELVSSEAKRKSAHLDSESRSVRIKREQENISYFQFNQGRINIKLESEDVPQLHLKDDLSDSKQTVPTSLAPHTQDSYTFTVRGVEIKIIKNEILKEAIDQQAEARKAFLKLMNSEATSVDKKSATAILAALNTVNVSSYSSIEYETAKKRELKETKDFLSRIILNSDQETVNKEKGEAFRTIEKCLNIIRFQEVAERDIMEQRTEARKVFLKLTSPEATPMDKESASTILAFLNKVRFDRASTIDEQKDLATKRRELREAKKFLSTFIANSNPEAVNNEKEKAFGRIEKYINVRPFGDQAEKDIAEIFARLKNYRAYDEENPGEEYFPTAIRIALSGSIHAQEFKILFDLVDKLSVFPEEDKRRSHYISCRIVERLVKNITDKNKRKKEDIINEEGLRNFLIQLLEREGGNGVWSASMMSTIIEYLRMDKEWVKGNIILLMRILNVALAEDGFEPINERGLHINEKVEFTDSIGFLRHHIFRALISIKDSLPKDIRDAFKAYAQKDNDGNESSFYGFARGIVE